MAYESKISVAKGTIGAVDGALAAVVTTLVIGYIKMQIKDMDPNTENAIAALVGVAVSAVVVAVKKFTENWMKHKDDGKPATPVAPAAPAEAKKEEPAK
jgi:CDP-diglyceride synthetase